MLLGQILYMIYLNTYMYMYRSMLLLLPFQYPLISQRKHSTVAGTMSNIEYFKYIKEKYLTQEVHYKWF